MPTVYCQKTEITSGSNVYPIYTGFMRAADILAVASAPSFNPATLNCEIAKNATEDPVKQWQRPLDPNRVDVITRLFSDTGEFMPNPVLLSENVTTAAGNITIDPTFASGSIPMPLFKVEISTPTSQDDKPLWILDGQHRINGLGNSLQAHNMIPVVLLLNQGGSYYSGSTLAKIFAQVTTTARGLDDMHGEWLTFAFHLGKSYSRDNPQHREHHRAMECVAELCIRQHVRNGALPNSFWDKVQFSHFRPGGPAPGGFAFTCGDLKQLIWSHYYHEPGIAGVAQLEPAALAEQLALAHRSLTHNVTGPHSNTVFFSTGAAGQRIMQEAFLVGVLTHILHHGTPSSWDVLLKNLAFDSTDWNFSWVRSLHGRANKLSKDLAATVFREAFRTGNLPPGSATIADFLRGNNASITLEFSELTSTGRPQRRGRKTMELTKSMTTSTNITPRTHVKMIGMTGNVGRVEFVDAQSPPGRPVYHERIERPGLRLDGTVSNPLKLRIILHHYGDNDSAIDLDISW